MSIMFPDPRGIKLYLAREMKWHPWDEKELGWKRIMVGKLVAEDTGEAE